MVWWINQTFTWYKSSFGLATLIISFQWLLNPLIFFSTTPASFDAAGAVFMATAGGALFGSTLLTSKSPFVILCTYNLTFSNPSP